MSEQIKKINFSALKNNNTDIINEKKMTSSPESIKQETTSTWIKPKIQISLWKKKNILQKDNDIKETIKKEDNIEKDKINEEVIKTENISQTKETIKKEENIVKNENNIEKDKTNKEVIKTEDISQTKETIKKEEITTKNENNIKKNKTNEEVIIWDEILLKEPEKLFSNYESDFSVKQDSIIDKIKKLKNLPKTRPMLVFWMLWFLIIWVAWLVFISPDNSYLKVSILWVKKEKILIQKDKKLSETVKTNTQESKTQKEKIKKEKLENFLLHKDKKNININIKIKNKEEKLKELLLKAKKLNKK